MSALMKPPERFSLAALGSSGGIHGEAGNKKLLYTTSVNDGWSETHRWR